MSTFGTMVSEIREELRRQNIDPAIKRGIGAAVLFHRDKRFAFNELSFTFTTTADEAEYDENDDANIGRLAKIDSAKIVSPETPLNLRTIEFIRDRIDISTGTPEDIAYYEEQIFLSPTPSRTLSVSVFGILELKDTNQAAVNQII